MIINCSSAKTSKGMILNGNILSGDTYGVREHIKSYWGGRWDAQRKVWIVEPEKVTATIKSQARLIDMLLSISDEKATEAAPAASHIISKDSRPCTKCGTYCYGDCSAH